LQKKIGEFYENVTGNRFPDGENNVF